MGVEHCVVRTCEWMSDVLSVCLFFFKQKAAYEMRISDWSSDVCSSDLSCSSLEALPHLDCCHGSWFTPASVCQTWRNVCCGLQAGRTRFPPLPSEAGAHADRRLVTAERAADGDHRAIADRTLVADRKRAFAALVTDADAHAILGADTGGAGGHVEHGRAQDRKSTRLNSSH